MLFLTKKISQFLFLAVENILAPPPPPPPPHPLTPSPIKTRPFSPEKIYSYLFITVQTLKCQRYFFINVGRKHSALPCFCKHGKKLPPFDQIQIFCLQIFIAIKRFALFDKKFIFRYQDLVEIYVSAETIISDAFSYSENV